ncbi:MAG: hypothetical protein NT105_07465 [Verrucomicrobia bacterium]|nr:hypothetical protein [Verrucomicrobiota bacterium]
MKPTTHLICILTSLLASHLLAADTPIQTGKGHHFACTDYSGGKVFIVNIDGKVEWEYKTGSCNDLWVLPNGNLLFNTGTGVQEVTRDKKIVFDYKGSPFKRIVKQKGGPAKEIEGPSEIYACQRLANGNTFIGECNTGRLLVVTPAGKVVKEVRLLPEGKDGGHAYIRNARYLSNGNFLVTHYAEEAVREYDPQGKLVRAIPAKGGPHSAVRLPSGNTLIAIGDRPDGHRVFEVDPAGKTVWEVKDGDLPGLSLKFMTGVQRLPNGNTVITNWLGHGQFGKSAHIIEVTPDKQVVWTFADHKTMKTVSSIQLLDVPGDCTKGEILH